MQHPLSTPYLYLFLIARMQDDQLYNPTMAAALLELEDIQKHNLQRRTGRGGHRTLPEAREVARASLTIKIRKRITVEPSGFVSSRNSSKKLHPAYTGAIWKSAFGLPGYQGLHLKSES